MSARRAVCWIEIGCDACKAPGPLLCVPLGSDGKPRHVRVPVLCASCLARQDLREDAEAGLP